MSVKYIFVTGGVVSGIGKGITAASIGRLLKARGYRVTMQKFDPYINFDPNTMSPLQHGEVFVTDDGAETDLDVGHYERFIDENLNKTSDSTTGHIYSTVINRERRGDFNGGTVQVIPHITNEIKERIFSAARMTENTDIVITEIGGTVGDIESLPFLEAIRQVAGDVGRQNCVYVHVTLIPYLAMSGELKSKPTQHSVKELLGLGIQPDVIVPRSDFPLTKDIRNKIALFCNIDPDGVVPNYNAETLYDVPLMLEKEGLAKVVCRKLQLEDRTPDLKEWAEICEKAKHLTRKTRIALVGKYVELHDAYLSVAEALKHAGIHNDAEVEIDWVNAEDVTEENAAALLKEANGILVPGGFGERGNEGKICAVKYARENNVPFLGIGLGMQLAVVEFARNVAGLSDAHSTEMAPDTTNPVIYIMPDQSGADLGSTMRLGQYPCRVEKGTLAYQAYGEELIHERHRHRYEFNNDYREKLAAAGMKLSGISPDDRLVEMVELPEHKWFVGAQFHPEFKSRPNRPNPLLRDFVKASLEE